MEFQANYIFKKGGLKLDFFFNRTDQDYME